MQQLPLFHIVCYLHVSYVYQGRRAQRRKIVVAWPEDHQDSLSLVSFLTRYKPEVELPSVLLQKHAQELQKPSTTKWYEHLHKVTEIIQSQLYPQDLMMMGEFTDWQIEQREVDLQNHLNWVAPNGKIMMHYILPEQEDAIQALRQFHDEYVVTRGLKMTKKGYVNWNKKHDGRYCSADRITQTLGVFPHNLVRCGHTMVD